MEKNQWKITAVVLAALLLLETIGIVGLFYLGYDAIAKENKCQTLCVQGQEDTYYYEYGVCTCYTNHIQTKTTEI